MRHPRTEPILQANLSPCMHERAFQASPLTFPCGTMRYAYVTERTHLVQSERLIDISKWCALGFGFCGCAPPRTSRFPVSVRRRDATVWACGRRARRGAGVELGHLLRSALFSLIYICLQPVVLADPVPRSQVAVHALASSVIRKVQPGGGDASREVTSQRNAMSSKSTSSSATPPMNRRLNGENFTTRGAPSYR